MCTPFCEPAEKYSAHRPIQSHSVHCIIRFRWAVLRWFFFSYALSQPHESNVTIISTVVVVIIISVSTLNVFHLCPRITLILQNENWDKTKAKAQSHTTDKKSHLYIHIHQIQNMEREKQETFSYVHETKCYFFFLPFYLSFLIGCAANKRCRCRRHRRYMALILLYPKSSTDDDGSERANEWAHCVHTENWSSCHRKYIYA